MTGILLYHFVSWKNYQPALLHFNPNQWFSVPVSSSSNGSWQPASGPRLARKQSWIWFQTRPNTWPGASWPAKHIPVAVNPRVVPGLARPVGSNLWFSFSGFSIYGRSLICYYLVQNMNFGISFSVFVSLAALIIKSMGDMLPAKSWSWVWTFFCLASLVRFAVQNSHCVS